MFSVLFSFVFESISLFDSRLDNHSVESNHQLGGEVVNPKYFQPGSSFTLHNNDIDDCLL